jgi:tetratricopeptide (TPR) repeat protein
MDTIIGQNYFVEEYMDDREDLERSIELLQMELEKFVNMHQDEDLQEADAEVQNEAGFLLYTIGKNFYMLQDYETAAEYFETGLAFNLDVNDDYVLEMATAYGLSLLNCNKGREAIVLEAVYDFFDGQADFVFMMGLVYMERINMSRLLWNLPRLQCLWMVRLPGRIHICHSIILEWLARSRAELRRLVPCMPRQ